MILNKKSQCLMYKDAPKAFWSLEASVLRELFKLSNERISENNA